MFHACGVPMGNFISRALGESVKDCDSEWSAWFSLLESPHEHLPTELVRHVGSTIALAWKTMPEKQRTFLELLSRVDLTPEQAKVLAIPEERRAFGIDIEDSDFIRNPYLLFEATRLTSMPISIGAVDRGFFPTASVRERFPAPKPSRIDTPVDSRRLRALTIRELESASIKGDTVVPRAKIVENLRLGNHSKGAGQTLVTADLLRAAEAEQFRGQVRIVEMADGSPAYQLERLAQAGDLIRRTVTRRAAARRHDLEVDWRAELDRVLGDAPRGNGRESEERARREKAAALHEIANARFSVLIGSAGTGKTTLLSVLCEHPAIKSGGVLLLAPTGKARVRMEQLVGESSSASASAYTVAQLLTRLSRYDPRTQRYILTGPQRERLGSTVVIDECSMLTEEMLAALLNSLAGVDRLILVGDRRQLPPIGAGRPFVDIVNYLEPAEFPGGFPRVGSSYAELTVPRRQDIHDRDSLDLAEWFGGQPGPSHDSVFEILSGHRQSNSVKVVRWETEDELKSKLPQLLARELEFDQNAAEELEFAKSLGGQEAGGYAYFNKSRSGAHAENWQILSPSRQKPYGTIALNRLIHQRYKSRLVEVATVVPKGRPRRFLRPQSDQLIVYGDKVINNRNTHVPKRNTWPEVERFLANGEIGIVVGQMRTRKFNYKPRWLEVEFSTQTGSVVKFWPREFNEEGEANLELAYALTVHKAQGSEFGAVLLVLPKFGQLLTRELVYTALTRQKKKLVILMQGSISELQRLSSESYSEVAGRLTNLFSSPKPILLGERVLEEGLIHLTARGEAVRSKSEVIIANLLHASGVDYQYEQPLEREGVIKYPDFTIEDDDTGETYYWEHLGLLSDEGYRRRWSEKRRWYNSNGIFAKDDGGGPAGTLITTEDSPEGAIDSAHVSRLVDDLFSANR